MIHPCWKPSLFQQTQSAMALFQTKAEERTGRKFVSYRDLHSWSVTHELEFWEMLADFVGIKWMTPPNPSIHATSSMLDVSWFPGGVLNFCANLLPESSNNEVIVSYVEGGPRRSLTGLTLHNAVFRCAKSLKACGVGPGDKVAGVLSNGLEAIVAMLATASLGAVWSSCSPDFGATGIFDRLSQIDAKVIFLTRNYFYNGKLIHALDSGSDAIERLSPKPQVVICDHLDSKHDEFWKFCGGWNELTLGEEAESYAPRRFHDPLYILFSSGTTGLPKCLVHSVGGTLLQHKKELLLHSDLRKGDSLFYFTTCGWMMWNWMASALACDAKVVTYDGSPTYPNHESLWKVVADEQVTHFGTSPKFLASCMQQENFSPHAVATFSHLRTILSTGSPLLIPHFEWVYRWFPNVHLASISGGTDIISCFMLGNPTLPVYPGEIQCAGLGMAVEAWDDNATPVYGKKGELVCVKPFVSMPVGFLNDPDGRRYRKAYFDAYGHKEVWRHGDFIEITERGGIIIYGRSDATLNPGGVRIGTAEIYRCVESLPYVQDSLAIGHRRDDDVEIILFVKLKTNTEWSEELAGQIKSRIRKDLTPRHVPRQVVPVADIPYTRSGKKIEIAVTQLLHGEPIGNLSALANPESLAEYHRIKTRLG